LNGGILSVDGLITKGWRAANIIVLAQPRKQQNQGFWKNGDQAVPNMGFLLVGVRLNPEFLMSSAATLRCSSKILGFVSYVILRKW